MASIFQAFVICLREGLEAFLIVAISLVYSATRYDDWPSIFREAFRWGLRMSGFLTWLIWAVLHVLALPQHQNRFRVQTQWFWSYVTGQRSSRLISEPPRSPGA